jgi:acyl-CoA hydrolase
MAAMGLAAIAGAIISGLGNQKQDIVRVSTEVVATDMVEEVAEAVMTN